MGFWGQVGSGSVRIAAGNVAFAATTIALAHAQAPQDSPATTACRAAISGSGIAAKILDGRSFLLSDGREVRIAGIEVPPAPQPGETGPQASAGAAARAALQSILAGRSVALYRSATDRYGRTLAYVDVTVEGSARPVETELVGRGLARVGPRLATPACAAELLGRERSARDAKLGLWADPYYDVIKAESGARLLAQWGRFTVVEGKVVSVRASGGTLYLNFGRRWSQALTVTILKRHERIFAGAGVQPKRLENRNVRVRGWIDRRNGPRIEATRPEQIEMAELK